MSIFRKAGISDQAAELANLGAGSLNLAISLLGPILMARVNRRSLMLFSTSFCCLFLLSFALMLFYIVCYIMLNVGANISVSNKLFFVAG